MSLRQRKAKGILIRAALNGLPCSMNITEYVGIKITTSLLQGGVRQGYLRLAVAWTWRC